MLLPRPVGETAQALAAAFAAGQALRLVNYHATPRTRAVEFAREADALAARYAPLDRAGLDRLMAGEGLANRPCVIPVLFEGFRDNYDVMLPILEARGLVAWFCLPPAFATVEADKQRAFAAAQSLHYLTDEYPGARIAMTWDEIRDAHARGHVMACHTLTHTRLTPETPAAELHREIVTAKEVFEGELGAEVDIFCYLHGAEVGLNPRADRMLIDAGYRYLLSNFRLQKLQ